MLNKTKIICTIGQQSESEEVLEKMIQEGMNVARFNLANGGIPATQHFLESIRKLSLIHDRTISFIIDTYGPKMRTHSFKEVSVSLAKGCKVVIYTDKEVVGTASEFSINNPNAFNAIEIEDRIYVNNGSVVLLAINKNVKEKTIECEVLHSGMAESYCTINIPSIKNDLPFISNEDQSVYKFAISNNLDFIGLSAVRNANDIKDARKYLEDSGSKINLLAKIESKEAYENIDEIISEADGIIVPRGDLSVDVTNEECPIILKKIIAKVRKAGKPIIVGTQVLSSMTRSKNPSRAEVSDVTNLVLDGVDGISLSNATSIGAYPSYAVKELMKIINKTEQNVDELLNHNYLVEDSADISVTDNAVASSVVLTSKITNAKLIVSFSESGATSRRISNYRVNCPIASVTSNQSIRALLSLNWGIYPVVISHPVYEIDYLDFAREVAVYYGLKQGDTFIITGGNGVGNTNLMKVCKL